MRFLLSFILFTSCLCFHSAGAQEKAAKSPFGGIWKNTNPNSRWHGKLEVEVTKDDSVILWLYDTPGKKRSAKAEMDTDKELFLSDEPGSIAFSIDHGFKNDTFEMEIIRGTILRVKASSVFTDDSGRKPYSVVEEFTRVEAEPSE